MNAVKGDPKLPIGGEPRVQLLPQSVRDRAKAGAVRRRLAMLVVLALVVVGGGYAYGFLRNLTAQQQLESARAETSAILTEQAQYSEGTRAAAQVAGIQAAQTYTTSNEVLWEPLLQKIAGLMPEGTRVGQVVALGQAPWEPPLSVEGPLRSPRVAVLTVMFTSSTAIDPSLMVARLATLEGFVDARFDSSIWDETYLQYQTTVRVMLDGRAASGRYAEATADAETDADAANTEDEG